MNHYTVLELVGKDDKPTGKFHYTRNRRPTGYCSENCPGHDSEDAAYEHYRQYLLDNANFKSGTTKNTMHKCQIKECDRYTETITRVMTEQFFFLCEDHANKESLEKILEVGDSWASW